MSSSRVGRLLLFSISAFIFHFNGAEALSLQDALKMSLNSNPQIMSDRANLNSSFYQVSQAKGQYLPHLDVEAAYGREHSEDPILASLNTYPANLWRRDASVVASQLIYDGQKTVNQIREKKYFVQENQFLVASKTEQIAFDTAEAYLNVLREQKLVDLAKKNVSEHQKIFAMIQLRVNAQAGLRVEHELAEARLASANVSLAKAIQDYQTAVYRYQNVVGQMPQHLSLPSMNFKYLPTSLASAIHLGLEDNPAIYQYLSKVKESDALVAESKAAFLPTLKIQASGSNGNNLDGIVGENRDLMVRMVANYNILNGGSDQAALNEARAKKLGAVYNLNDIRRQVVQNIQNAWAELSSTNQQVQQLQTYVTSNKNVIHDYTIQFQIGKRELFNVLDAEREQFVANSALVDALFDQQIASYRLLANIGTLSKSLLHSEKKA